MLNDSLCNIKYVLKVFVFRPLTSQAIGCLYTVHMFTKNTFLIHFMLVVKFFIVVSWRVEAMMNLMMLLID